MASPVARNILLFRQYLVILESERQRYDWKKKSGGLVELARPLFEPKYDYHQLSLSLSNSLKQLGRNWCFLQIFVESICMCAVGEEIQSLIEKLDAVVGEIREDIFGCDISYYLKRPHKLLGLLSKCQRKTDKLCRTEIREALEELPNSTIHVRSADSRSLPRFVSLVAKNLPSMKHADVGVINEQVGFLQDELQGIERYLLDVQDSLRDNDQESRDFLTHIASVVLRIAIHSCNFWFNRTEPKIAKVKATYPVLLDLRREIDPTYPEFLELNLRFQKVLCERSYHTTPTSQGYLLRYFCNYLLWDKNLGKELMSLVTLYFKTALKDGEDVQSFFAEIKAVLGEAAFIHRAAHREEPFSFTAYHTELVTKVCLLQAEFFLKEQLNTSTSLMLFDEVDTFLTNLGAFTKYLCRKQNTEYLRQSSALAEELCNEVQSLHTSFRSKRITNSFTKHSLLQLLFKIVFFKAESFLSELLKSSDALISHEKDQIRSLVEELKYFKRIITNKLERETSEEKLVISQVEAVVRETIFFSYSFLPDNDKFNKMIRSLPQLLDKVKIVRAKLLEMSKQFPMSIFPKTCELGFFDFLGRNIRELLIYDPKSIALVKHHIKEVQLHLDYLKSFLMKEKDSDSVQGTSKDLADHIIHVSYKLEYVVDSIEVDGHLQQSVWLYDLLEDIRRVHEQVSKTHEMPCAGTVQNLPQISCEMTSRDTKLTVDEMVVDLGNEEQAIIDRLTGGSSQRNVVSIVGMSGIGKTTLARKVYNNRNVIYHFHRRAWCTVSRVYSKRGLLLEILSDVHGLTEEIYQMTDEDLLLKLHQFLLKNKYLVVLDDVWDIEAWKDLEKSFPDDRNGSRILMTSRLRDVGLKIKPDNDPHSVRLLSDEECWTLIERRVFKGKTCPQELLQVGMEIAQHCQGLPLAVVAIAGLLQKIQKRQNWWKKISKSLRSEIINDPENRCMEILELSYRHLPECLKACFLYLGIFLEDKDIPVNKLIRFWMAEGFIQESESKSLEDVAEEYLLELINRSLVIISKTRSNGKVKACRLHDLLRDLCLLKAKEENFFHLVTRNDEPYSSFPDSDFEMELNLDFDELAPIKFKSYRLAFYLKRNHFIDSRPSGPGTRSLLFFASTDSDPGCPYDILFISHNFKLLRVLDLECINMGVSFPVEIGSMDKLRYLAVCGYIRSIPPSIAKLQKLETLVVKGLRGKVMLPETLWSMARLRHLHVNNHVVFSLQGLDKQVGSSLHLDNLVSFSTPSLTSVEDTMNILRRLPNLRKMRCLWYSSKNCNGFPIFNLLTHLESLKMIYYGRSLNSGEFVLPLNLKKLTLSRFRLPWDHISAVGRLPNLRVLNLRAGAFEGLRWEMREEEFGELKFLELDTLNIVEWNASRDHLPKLERLVLRNCKDLEIIPRDFAEINTLQMIEVQWCGKSVEESAKEIGDVTGEIKVLVSQS